MTDIEFEKTHEFEECDPEHPEECEPEKGDLIADERKFRKKEQNIKNRTEENYDPRDQNRREFEFCDPEHPEECEPEKGDLIADERRWVLKQKIDIGTSIGGIMQKGSDSGFY